jgi:hypothetical protein
MSVYEVVIEVWPHSTGRGSEVDQKQAGAREQRFQVRADDMRAAMVVAETICVGLKQNPIVYMTPIKSIGQMSSTDARPGSGVVQVLTERGECYIK